ncbi:MAG: hypothetical protein NC341_04975 [Blautia sp.]|nr:hypothetical protein [Blautia sp.]MCM1199701.1 hypothetical protein [Bacteroides fragilis]
MDFQENRQTEIPAQEQAVNQDAAPVSQQASNEVPADNAQSAENRNGPSYQNGQPQEAGSGPSYPNGQPSGNNNSSPYPGGQPYQNRPPYGNGTPYPAPQQPCGSQAGAPNQNHNACRSNTPYGNQYPNGSNYPNGNQYPNGSNYPNGNQYPNGNSYPNQNGYPGGYNPNGYRPNNGYNNNYPYYNRNSYQIPAAEPGSSLANAAMICGILSMVSCLTFTVYPAFMLGSVAIILALLSRGRRSSLFSKAKTGIICAAVGLVLNAVILTSSITYVFTNPEGRAEFNRTWEKIYGMPFDDMIDDMMENNSF